MAHLASSNSSDRRIHRDYLVWCSFQWIDLSTDTAIVSPGSRSIISHWWLFYSMDRAKTQYPRRCFKILVGWFTKILMPHFIENSCFNGFLDTSPQHIWLSRNYQTSRTTIQEARSNQPLFTSQSKASISEITTETPLDSVHLTFNCHQPSITTI